MDICKALSWIVPLRTGGQQKRPLFEPLRSQNQPGAVPDQDLQTVAPLGTEDEHIAAKRIAFSASDTSAAMVSMPFLKSSDSDALTASSLA